MSRGDRWTATRLRPFGVTIFAEMTALARKHDAVNLAQGIFQATQTVVDGCNRLLRGIELARMPHHIRIGVVDNDQVKSLGANGGNEFIGHFTGGHFRLQIIGRDFRGRHQDPFFPVEYLFAAAIQEEGDVGILFGFCEPQLSHTKPGNILAQ